ncbi:MAG: OmpH family outer membrane protein [Acidobacteria bacterium]|nr:OmpH family outer membrane protein [Acidobacteriota bacterium]
MHQRILLGLLVTSLLIPVALWAQAPAASQAQPSQIQPAAPAIIGPARIAWLNLEQAMLSCEDGKQAFGEVQKFVDKKNSELEQLRKEVETLRNQLNVQGPKLTDEARADLEDQIEGKDTLLQRFQQDTQKEIDSRRVRATNAIGRKMLPIIEKMAREKGLSAILYINPSRDAYIEPGLVITDEVIRAYNAAYPATAAKPPAAAPAKTP